MSLKTNYRFEELDALRGIAAIVVLLHHFLYVYSQRYGYDSFNFFQGVDISNSLGRYGVELFFMISGFVISMSLENKRGIRYFFISRFSRLFPTFWFCLFFTISFKLIFDPFANFTLSNIVANVTMIPLFFWEKPVDGSYWTLMYELFFYSIIAIAYKVTHKHYLILLSFLILAGVILLFSGVTPRETRTAYFLLIPHGQLFLAGVMFYQLWLSNVKGDKCGLLKSSLVAILFIQWSLSFIGTDRLNFVSSAMITLFFATFLLMINGKLRFIANSALTWAGTISYSLYLIHQEVGYIVIQKLIRHSVNEVFAIVLAIIFVFFLSFIINRLVEKPSNRWFKMKLDFLLR